MTLLGRFAQRLQLGPHLLQPQPPAQQLKLPTQELRSLCCSMVRRIAPDVDQTLWKRSKFALCGLLVKQPQAQGGADSGAGSVLAVAMAAAAVSSGATARAEQQPSADSATPGTGQTTKSSGELAGAAAPGAAADGDSPPVRTLEPGSSLEGPCEAAPGHWQGALATALQGLVTEHFSLDDQKVLQLLENPLIPEPQKAAIMAKHVDKKRELGSKVVRWCEEVLGLPDYALLQPILRQVLGVEAEPAPEGRERDGKQAELRVYDAVQQLLQRDWAVYASAHVVKVDGTPLLSKKFLKGEIDVLLADPSGVATVMLEVKTASGNPFLALYEDVVRLQALLEEIRGRAVTLKLPDRSQVQLQASPSLRAAYVLATEMRAEDMAGAAQNAYHKLLAAELGRQLSSQVELWRSINIIELTGAQATLQIPPELAAQLHATVDSFFASLETFEIYALVPASKDAPVHPA